MLLPVILRSMRLNGKNNRNSNRNVEPNIVLNGSGEAASFQFCPHSFLVIQPNVSEYLLSLCGVFSKRDKLI